MEITDHSKKSLEELFTSQQLTPEELATLIEMPVEVIRTAAHTGELKARIIDHHIVAIDRDDALAWLASR
jgi:hypothetical protein